MGRTWRKATRHLWPIEDDAETESDDGTDSPSQDNSPQCGIIMALASTSSAALTDDNTNCGHKFSSDNLWQDTESDSETQSDSDDPRNSRRGRVPSPLQQRKNTPSQTSFAQSSAGNRETSKILACSSSGSKPLSLDGAPQMQGQQQRADATVADPHTTNQHLHTTFLNWGYQSRVSSSHLETAELLCQPPYKYRRVSDQKTIALPAEDSLLAYQCASCSSLRRDFGSDLLEEMDRVDLEALVSRGHIINFLGWIFCEAWTEQPVHLSRTS